MCVLTYGQNLIGCPFRPMIRAKSRVIRRDDANVTDFPGKHQLADHPDHAVPVLIDIHAALYLNLQEI